MFRKLFPILSILLILYILTGCDETSVTPGSVNVNGQFINGFYGLDNYTVEIGGKRTTTDRDGNFSIPDVKIPYDITFAPPHEPRGGIIIYQNITKQKIHLNASPEVNEPYHKKFSQILITIPPPGYNQRVIASFVPDNGEEKVFVQPFWSTNLVGVDIKWQNAETISGKWVVLSYSGQNYNITSYDKYYETPGIDINHGSILHDTIEPGDTYVNPVESTIGGMVEDFQVGSYVSATLNFSFPNTYSKILMMNQTADPNFEFLIPSDILNGLNFNVTAYNGNSRRSAIVSPGSNNVVELFLPPEFQSLQNNDSISFNNTQFNWTQGGGNGIYAFHIYPDDTTSVPIWIYTDQPYLTIPDLSVFGYLYKGNGYSHKVYLRKYFPFNNMNEFVDESYRLENYEGYSTSSSKTIRVY